MMPLASLALWTLSALAQDPPAGATWEVLQEQPVKVECTTDAAEPWCRATARVGAPSSALANTLEHMADHADKFGSLRSLKALAPNVLHVVIDFPGMLSDRDYVALYAPPTDEGGKRLYRWTATTHAEAPPVDGVVRLPRFAGSWALEPSGAETRVTYTWQADLAGSFPSWALPIARKKTGGEALGDLAKAAGSKLVGP
jgi:hypothetical protein